mgnify:CR=1 FL=1
MQGLFGNLNNTLNNLGLSGNLGLLTTGVGLLEGQPIGEAVRSGLQTYQGLSTIDEERKRKALVQDLVSKGGFTQQEQALILASQNPASVAAQIRAQKAAASKPNIFQQRQDIGTKRGLEGTDLNTFVLTGDLPKGVNFEILPADQAEALGFAKGTILQKNTDSGDISVLQTAPKPGKPKDNFEILPADQAEALGFAKGSIVERNTVTNDYNVIQSPQETPATFQYLTKDQKLNLGFDENSVVQVNTQTKATKVVKEAPKQNETFRILSADEVANAGFKEGTIVQKSDLSGKNTVLEQAPKLDSTRKTLTKAELLAAGFNEGDVVQKDEITQALFVVKSAAAPKNTSLVNLVSQQDVTIDGRTYKAGTVFALDQTTQQKQLLEAGKQGAIIAPSKVEQVTSPTVDTSKVDELVSSIAADTSDTSLNLNVGTAAGGDIPGFVTDVLNTVFGAFTGSFSPDRKRQIAVLNEANNTIKVPLVKALNRAGSKFAIEQVDTILPQPSNQNETFIQRFDALKPRLDIAIKQLAADSLNTELTEGERIAAQDEARQLIEYQQNMQSAIDVYRKNRGGTKTQTQKKADEILGIGK